MKLSEKQIQQIWKGRRERQLNTIRFKAKKIDREFNITIDDIDWVSHCPILGIELNYWASSKEIWQSPSIDRVDNSKGYIPGNVRVISFAANKMKSTYTVDVFEKMVAYMKGDL